MKAVIFSALAFSLLSVAVAANITVTQTFYSDSSCTSIAVVSGMVNPLVAPLNACVANSAATYVKIATCSGSMATGASFSDSACQTLISSSYSIPISPSCQSVVGVVGAASLKSFCSDDSQPAKTPSSSASSATLAFIFAIASGLVLCL
jgi:hypothetical protein